MASGFLVLIKLSSYIFSVQIGNYIHIIYTYVGFKGLLTSPYLKEFGELLI